MQFDFDTIYIGLKKPLVRHIARYVKDSAKAEELLQETFLKAWEKRESFVGKGSVQGWIFRIATNLCLDHLRSFRNRTVYEHIMRSVESDDEDISSFLERTAENPFPNPDAVFLRSEYLLQIRRQLSRLPVEKQRLVDLVYREERSLKDAADRLGVPYSTAKSRLHYAMKQLNRLLESYHEEEGV